MFRYTAKGTVCMILFELISIDGFNKNKKKDFTINKWNEFNLKQYC